MAAEGSVLLLPWSLTVVLSSRVKIPCGGNGGGQVHALRDGGGELGVKDSR